MKKRRWERNLKKYKLLLIFFLALTVIFTVWKIPPKNYFVVGGFTLLVSLLVVTGGSLVISYADALLLGFFVLLFMATTAVAGFNLINTILLVSFIIGCKLLLSGPHKGTK